MSRKKYIFAFAFEKFTDRDVAQLVAHTSGGREVASSSLVIPTKSNVRGKRLRSLPFFYIFSSRRIVEFFCLELFEHSSHQFVEIKIKLVGVVI